MYVVSANYRDRRSNKKWLVRRKDEGTHRAMPYEGVVATGVQFTRSNAYEQGFGCSIVAQCKSAIGFEAGAALPTVEGGPRLREVRLRFGGFSFKDYSGNVVNGCETLILHADGSMTGFIAVEASRRTSATA